MEIHTRITITESFRSLIKSGNYEKYVHTIINRSSKIFSGRSFNRIDCQSNGECDFIDNLGQKYDAKLILDKKQGKLIGDLHNEHEIWVQDLFDEASEFAEIIQNRELSLVSKTRLYEILKSRIKSVEHDEYAILFIPFPIVIDCVGSVFSQFATDFLQAVYDCLANDGIVGNRRIFFIYPAMSPHLYVLRNEHRLREYIKCEELDDLIIYDYSLTGNK